MRRWNAYELTQLLRYGIDPDRAAVSFPLDMPVEYITGHIDFHKHQFIVSTDVLIPRHETEQLVDIALAWIRLQDHQIDFIDVGTGSGVIGISLLIEAPEKINHGYLVDISTQALAIARQNVQKLIPASSVTLINQNLLSGHLPKVDLIIANLPYVPSDRLPLLPPSVRDYEPHIALDGGPTGLKLITDLLTQAKSQLNQNGIVLLEVDDTHIDPSQFTDWEIELRRDEQDKPRYWIAYLR